jgi:hypothetical protein
VAPYTLFHVILSLAGILSGLVVMYGLIRSERMNGWTLLFLTTTVATSVTGFGFPFHGPTPALAFGVISLAVLAAVIAARYRFHLAGPWRWIYAAGCALALYLNCFVLVVQAFLKVPALHALAPNGSEPPFGIAQGLTLVAFVAIGTLAVRRFHPAPA